MPISKKGIFFSYYLSYNPRMYYHKKEKLYVADIVTNAIISYPPYYHVSASMMKNDYLHDTLEAIHMLRFENHHVPENLDELFQTLGNIGFVIYKEKYAVGYFGDKLMYLESNGWKGLYASKETFNVDNWLV